MGVRKFKGCGVYLQPAGRLYQTILHGNRRGDPSRKGQQSQVVEVGTRTCTKVYKILA